MNILLFIFRLLYRIRFWLIGVPLAVGVTAFWSTRSLPRTYSVETTIYTGVISGYNAFADAESSTSAIQAAMMENLVNIVTSSGTLKLLSMRLYAENMIHGDASKDNNYIKASNYRSLMARTPSEVLTLIDKNSVDSTVKRLLEYEKQGTDNFIYGLFNWNDPHYSYGALKAIVVKRYGNSDMLKIGYSSDDPGIACNTLRFLNEVFVKQFEELRFAGTNDVVLFFQQELSKVRGQLTVSEDSLTLYNVNKKVINYDEQTKQVAAMSRDFKLEYEDNLRNYSGAKAIVKALEDRLGANVQKIRKNRDFITKLNTISELTSRITEVESFTSDTTSVSSREKTVERYREKLTEAKKDFISFSEAYYLEKYSKEGYPNEEVVAQWLDELLRLSRFEALKGVLDKWKNDLDNQYSYYSPIGATIKRQEREIDFIEQSYLSILRNLHDAILRQKSMQMASATLRVVSPPAFPLDSMPTKRRALVFAAFLASMVFTLGYFLLLEFLDQTLHDQVRTERITGGKVLGGFPRPLPPKQKELDAQIRQIAAKYMTNALASQFGTASPKIINLYSSEKREGKSFLAAHLCANWEAQGFNVRHIDWEKDFEPESRQFLLAQQLSDYLPYHQEDILVVEYPFLQEYSVPASLVREGTLNVFVTRANRTWKNTDRIIFDKLVQQAADKPPWIYLNLVDKAILENYTGMLPPYTRFKRYLYRLAQLGFSATEQVN